MLPALSAADAGAAGSSVPKRVAANSSARIRFFMGKPPLLRAGRADPACVVYESIIPYRHWLYKKQICVKICFLRNFFSSSKAGGRANHAKWGVDKQPFFLYNHSRRALSKPHPQARHANPLVGATAMDPISGGSAAATGEGNTEPSPRRGEHRSSAVGTNHNTMPMQIRITQPGRNLHRRVPELGACPADERCSPLQRNTYPVVAHAP